MRDDASGGARARVSSGTRPGPGARSSLWGDDTVGPADDRIYGAGRPGDAGCLPRVSTAAPDRGADTRSRTLFVECCTVGGEVCRMVRPLRAGGGWRPYATRFMGCPRGLIRHATPFMAYRRGLIRHATPFISYQRGSIGHETPFIAYQRGLIRHATPFIAYRRGLIRHATPFMAHEGGSIGHATPFIAYETPRLGHDLGLRRRSEPCGGSRASIHHVADPFHRLSNRSAPL
jgi:hypothetical protein